MATYIRGDSTKTSIGRKNWKTFAGRMQIIHDAGVMLGFKKRLMAEFIGTFCLMFAGTGAIIINEVSGGSVTHLGIGLTFGLIVLAMIYTVGDISGAHINPAVTIAFAVARRFSPREIVPYIMAQTGGAFLASGLLKLMFPNVRSLGSTVPAGSQLQSFILEFVLTFILMLVVLNISTGSKEKGITAGIAVGAVIALEAIFAGPICGASMNPARSLAPAVLSVGLEHLWIYILAPIGGAIGAVFCCRCIRNEDCCSSRAVFTPA